MSSNNQSAASFILPELEHNLLSLSKDVGTHKKIKKAPKKVIPTNKQSLLKSLAKEFEQEASHLKSEVNGLREKYAIDPLKKAYIEESTTHVSLFQIAPLQKLIAHYAFADSAEKKAKIKAKFLRALAIIESKKHATPARPARR